MRYEDRVGFLAAFLVVFLILTPGTAHAERCTLYSALADHALEARTVHKALMENIPPEATLRRRLNRLYLVEQEARWGRLVRGMPHERALPFAEPLHSWERTFGILAGTFGVSVAGALVASGSFVEGFPPWVRAMFVCAGALCGAITGADLADVLRAPRAGPEPRAFYELEPVAREITALLDHQSGGDRVVWGAVVVGRRFHEAIRLQLFREGWDPLPSGAVNLAELVPDEPRERDPGPPEDRIVPESALTGMRP